MTPEIEHLGHACTQFSYKGLVVTSDPWFYPAFLKAWFPYPDNRHLLPKALDSDYIYLSHAHEDHFDREFLKQVDPTRTTLIAPSFRSRYLQRELKALGFAGPLSPIFLSHGESTTLPTGVKATMLTDRSHKEDSALLLETPEGFRYLNSNDCELAISDWPKNIDLLACQFSGATWYPQCYDFDAPTMARKTAEVRKSNFDRLCSRVKQTEAKKYLPSAGPAVFLPPDVEQFNSPRGIFASWEDVEADFFERFPAIGIYQYLEGDELLPDYQRKRKNEWSSWYGESEDPVTVEELNTHFRRLQRSNKRFLRDWKKDVNISSDTQNWQVKLGLLDSQLEESFNPEYFMDIPMRVLRAVVDGRCTWETALISHRVKLHREPDVYDLKLMGLLNFGDRPIQTLTMAKQQDPNEFVVKDGFVFQRWCPHAGEDLNYAVVADGKIKCPRHEWCWDAVTGECLTGQGVPLKTATTEEFSK